jgi:hypothetical protein
MMSEFPACCCQITDNCGLGPAGLLLAIGLPQVPRSHSPLFALLSAVLCTLRERSNCPHIENCDTLLLREEEKYFEMFPKNQRVSNFLI